MMENNHPDKILFYKAHRYIYDVYDEYRGFFLHYPYESKLVI